MASTISVRKGFFYNGGDRDLSIVFHSDQPETFLLKIRDEYFLTLGEPSIKNGKIISYELEFSKNK